MIGTVLGRLGKDAEIAVTSGGTQFVKFVLAENSFRGGKDETVWYDVVSYDQFVIDKQIKVLKKGSFAIVIGEVDSKASVGKNGSIYLNTRITATNIKVPNLGNGGDRKVVTEAPQKSEPQIETPSINMSNLNISTNVSTPQDNVKAFNLSDESAEDDLPF